MDVVFHLAALSSYKMHEENPTKGARVNVEGFVNTVEQARNDGCDTVVYASTSSIYGRRTEPSPEEMAVTAARATRRRNSPGSATRSTSTTTTICAAGLRFFSVYQGFGGAEEHKGEFANTVAQFADEIASGDAPELFGTASRPAISPTSTTSSAGSSWPPNTAERRVQPRTGEAYDFNTVVDMLNDELGTDVEPEYIENPPRGRVRPRHESRLLEDARGDGLGTGDRFEEGVRAGL